MILCLALCYNLYSRFEILQKTLDRGEFLFLLAIILFLQLLPFVVQTTNLNTLKEMHEVHEHRIDKDITINRNNITDVMKHLSNLTSDVSVIEGKLNKILQFVQTAPDIAKLPKDVEDLKSAVADIGAKWATDDKEVKITSEKQAQQKVLLDSMDGRIKIIEGNLSDVQDKTNNKFASTIASLQSDMQKLNSAVSNISYLLENLSKSQTKLDSWRSEIDNEINKLKSDKVNVENKTQTVKHVKKVLDSSVTPPNNVQN